MTSNNLKEINTLTLEYLKNPVENKALNLLRCCRSHSQHSLGVFLGRFLTVKYPYNIDILDEISIMLYYSNKKESAYDIHEKTLEFKGLNQEQSYKIIFNQHFSFESVENRYTSYSHNIVQKILNKKDNEIPLVTFSITTCKRMDLFEKTMNSFLNCCEDILSIDKWICVDDNSSKEDRQKMEKLYPFFQFYFKNESEKGHAKSMNIIRNLVKTPYLIHFEDDWVFYSKKNYIKECLDVLNDDSSLGQCLINKNFGETEECTDVVGGIFKQTRTGLRYYIHEFASTEEEKRKFIEKYGTYKNSSYWPHFSFRPSIIRTEVLNKVGEFNENANHFEMEYAYRYVALSYKSAFLESIYCRHTGRLTSERTDESKLNAYKLNDEIQFYGKEEKIKEKQETKVILKESSKSKTPFYQNIKTFVINLNRRPDRWEVFLNNSSTLDFLDFKRFPGIDGQKVESTRQLQQIFENNDYQMRRGMLGCAMSHISLFINLINETDKNIDTYLILEDDIEFQPDFEKKFKYFYEKLQKTSNWDLAFLGHHVRDLNNTSYKNQEKMPEIERIDVYQSFLRSLGGTTGFIIKRQGAIKLLEFLNNTSMTNGIDTVIQKSANDLAIYYCEPHLIFSECYRGDNSASLDTDIQHDFSTLEKTIPQRIRDELDYLRDKKIKIKKCENYEEVLAFLKHDIIATYYEGTEQEIEKIERICTKPWYKIGDKCIFIIPEKFSKEGEFYFHRFKVGNEYKVDLKL